MSAQYGTVEATEWLTPAMMRVVFGGDGLAGFASSGFADEYVNALFLPDGAPYSVPFDVDEARAGAPEHRPRGRRYTVREWDSEVRRLTIDFVTHGDEGFAGRWAQGAVPGDRLQMLGPSGGYAPDPDADWYLMAGDESALPAIAASLERIPAGRRCVVRVVVDDAGHEDDLETEGDLDLEWLHRRSAEVPEDLLPAAIAAIRWAPGQPDVFVHGEAGEVRAVRRILVAERGIEKDSASISPYWRRNHTDEAWRRVKREWLAEQERDV